MGNGYTPWLHGKVFGKILSKPINYVLKPFVQPTVQPTLAIRYETPRKRQEVSLRGFQGYGGNLFLGMSSGNNETLKANKLSLD